MSVRVYDVPDIGKIHLYKRRDARSIRLSIQRDGKIRVTLPYYVTYEAALDFVSSRAVWITKNMPRTTSARIQNGQSIGKIHTVLFYPVASQKKIHTRVDDSIITIRYPGHMHAYAHEIQLSATKACLRALRKQTEQLLFPRLEKFADDFGFTYADVQARQLKSRWGSCSNRGVISLNIYLVQLPWKYIDYVLMHELVHTVHMNHHEEFWRDLSRYIPDAKQLRKEMRTYDAAISIT